MKREEVVNGLKCILNGNVPCNSCPYGTPHTNRGYICKRQIIQDALDLLESQEDSGRVYIVAMKERGDEEMSIWAAPFVSRRKAEEFVRTVKERLAKYDMEDEWQIDIDSGMMNDDQYLDWIDARYEEREEEE